MREPDQIKKYFSGRNAIILQKKFILFETNLLVNSASFLRDIAARAKRDKKGNVLLIAVLTQES